ncbi:UPF0481 protein At3g47200-like [Elaeis guineensis]|uniref:UPF0481 protein At3g47200-like n=1 Tax=Elaeis guineensis var. tenera TaxID=51953 RepID=UPI003C6D3C8A
MAIGERSWVVDLHSQVENVNTLEELELWRKQCIYGVPAYIKDLNSKAYKPQLVSFGPSTTAKPMEEHKHGALLHVLKRSVKPLDDLLTEMEKMGEQLQDAYQNLDEYWRIERRKFLQLMIADGCFMLEIMRASTGNSSDYPFNDPIFGSHGVLPTVPYIRRDMLMIENQLPLLVLEKLVAAETGSLGNADQINKLVLKFCAPVARPPLAGLGLGLHPLDLFRRSLLQCPMRRPVPTSESGSSEIIRSALELCEFGIQFRRSRTSSLGDIRFGNGVLSLPAIIGDDTSELMFLNLMAFERLHPGAGNEVTSYVFFMDNIIGSAKDVSFLHSKGIIQNALGSDKAVANLFH